MMNKNRLVPDYIFETSWEVCNKIGGIYAVLSTRAKTMVDLFGKNLLFIGPDFQANTHTNEIEYFTENPEDPLSEWKNTFFRDKGLKLRLGTWNIKGRPHVILVDFHPCFEKKNTIYFDMWDAFRVNSAKAYGDYDESCMFAYAAGLVIESLYDYLGLKGKKVIAHFNEWMLGMGALYIQKHVPGIGTLFTTHATSIGRSIAGNRKPLYKYFDRYNGDQMAVELNMESKHSLEKQTAFHVDCFTTVSSLTARECSQLLEKTPDIVTPNGFELDLVPLENEYEIKRQKARGRLLVVVEDLLGEDLDENTLLVATSGRYEYKNKGLDVFIEAMSRLRNSKMDRSVVAFILVPSDIEGARNDLVQRLSENKKFHTLLYHPFYTHELRDIGNDNICKYLKYLNFMNEAKAKVKILFVPSYLNGNDGIFNMPYYDLLTGMDLTVFPSYYEPWGYTPHESVAFGIPTITTSLAGFGLWARKETNTSDLSGGVEVIERDDDNYFDVAEKIKDSVVNYAKYDISEKAEVRESCFNLAKKASWKHFIEYYLDAYDIALRKVEDRVIK